MYKIEFNLKVDEELQLRNIHPDDAEALFDLMERNRARLCPWIDPYAFAQNSQSRAIVYHPLPFQLLW
jgi:hypothetical protein